MPTTLLPFNPEALAAPGRVDLPKGLEHSHDTGPDVRHLVVAGLSEALSARQVNQTEVPAPGGEYWADGRGEPVGLQELLGHTTPNFDDTALLGIEPSQPPSEDIAAQVPGTVTTSAVHFHELWTRQRAYSRFNQGPSVGHKKNGSPRYAQWLWYYFVEKPKEDKAAEESSPGGTNPSKRSVRKARSFAV
jgi:hypothetical protein